MVKIYINWRLKLLEQTNYVIKKFMQNLIFSAFKFYAGLRVMSIAINAHSNGSFSIRLEENLLALWNPHFPVPSQCLPCFLIIQG